MHTRLLSQPDRPLFTKMLASFLPLFMSSNVLKPWSRARGGVLLLFSVDRGILDDGIVNLSYIHFCGPSHTICTSEI